MVSYKILWKVLIDNDKKKQDLMEFYGLASATFEKITKDVNTSTTTLLKIYDTLICTSNYVFKILPIPSNGIVR
jgi:DNA-binding Xre family transcriptional regulator